MRITLHTNKYYTSLNPISIKKICKYGISFDETKKMIKKYEAHKKNANIAKVIKNTIH